MRGRRVATCAKLTLKCPRYCSLQCRISYSSEICDSGTRQYILISRYISYMCHIPSSTKGTKSLNRIVQSSALQYKKSGILYVEWLELRARRRWNILNLPRICLRNQRSNHVENGVHRTWQPVDMPNERQCTNN